MSTSSPTRTIAVYTGNRAEYGLQFPILKALTNTPGLDTRLLVSGAHLTEQLLGAPQETVGLCATSSIAIKVP